VPYDGAVHHRPRAASASPAASLLVALLLGEAVVRLLTPPVKKSGYTPVRTEKRDLRPVNSRGYRDLERPRDKPPKIRRVVCIGDSFT
jgi:hypothetical protein